VTPLFEIETQIPNPQGFHLRPAQRVWTLANQFQAKITIGKDGRTYDAKDLLGLLQLVAHEGAKLTIRASGEDAEKAVRALVDLVERGFDEMPE
jgi:phosphotransferase system HPr (HPr) family protein